MSELDVHTPDGVLEVPQQQQGMTRVLPSDHLAGLSQRLGQIEQAVATGAAGVARRPVWQLLVAAVGGAVAGALAGYMVGGVVCKVKGMAGLRGR